MSEAPYAVIIFLLKLVLVAICSPLIGCLGLVTVPLRFWQAVTGRLKAGAHGLSSPAKKAVLAGTVVLFAAAIGWVGVVFEIYGAYTCTGAGCALAGLGIFVVLSLFGSAYGLAELLLSPATFPRHTNA